MNTLCAAGTGSFLDQQASRLGFTIEEFAEVALKSVNTPRIAGRCTVFAKSDMIHLQQIATPDYELVAGSALPSPATSRATSRREEIKKPVAFIGGVAGQCGHEEGASERSFPGQRPDSSCPSIYASMGALGAIYAVLDDPSPEGGHLQGVEELREHLARRRRTRPTKPFISPEHPVILRGEKPHEEGEGLPRRGRGLHQHQSGRHRREWNVLSKRYLMTAGQAPRGGEAGTGTTKWAEIGDLVEIVGVGTTGSGRYLTADFIGADLVRNEITAQAEAAIAIDPEVDTIFEIGGQDSKYISIDNGVIVDFEMNKACAAGTGSFLEEQAERLGISIKEEFSKLALSAKSPTKMGERCTVFIESDVMHCQQGGARTDDIVARPVLFHRPQLSQQGRGGQKGRKKDLFSGRNGLQQGRGGGLREGLRQADHRAVPPRRDRGNRRRHPCHERADLGEKHLQGLRSEQEALCHRYLRMQGMREPLRDHRVTCEGEKPLFYGSRCEKYDVVRHAKTEEKTDLFKIREELLHNMYDRNVDGEKIGIPQILNMHELLPFWRSFLTELGYSVVLSDATNKKLIKEGVENIIVESCFPIKLAHGHILNIVDKGINRIFMPSVINMKKAPKTWREALPVPTPSRFPTRQRPRSISTRWASRSNRRWSISDGARR